MKWSNQNLSPAWLKLLLSIVAIGCIAARIIWPTLKIDSVTLGLIVLALLPWFSEIIESLKLPGGWEVKFKDLKEAGEKVAQNLSPVSGPGRALAPSSVESGEP